MAPAPPPGAGRFAHLANLLRLARALTAPSTPAPPRAPAFPKAVFDTPPEAAPTPGGQSLDYLRLARAGWEARWPGAPEPDAFGAAMRAAHDAVQRAALLERALLDLAQQDLARQDLSERQP